MNVLVGVTQTGQSNVDMASAIPVYNTHTICDLYSENSGKWAIEHIPGVDYTKTSLASLW